jgi:hypothetical protein
LDGLPVIEPSVEKRTGTPNPCFGILASAGPSLAHRHRLLAMRDVGDREA